MGMWESPEEKILDIYKDSQKDMYKKLYDAISIERDISGAEGFDLGWTTAIAWLLNRDDMKLGDHWFGECIEAKKKAIDEIYILKGFRWK